MTPEISITEPIFDFNPLFYILDKCQLTVLVAKRQDAYEVSGLFVKLDRQKHCWEVWKAKFNNQLLWEFPDRFIITKDKDEAWLFAEIMSTAKPLPDDWCLDRYPRAKDFPKY